MAEICVFCKEQIKSPYPPRLEKNKMFMFEILMEQTSFDKDSLMNSPMCDDCDKTVLNFYNFKSKFMETEDEFLNYMDSNKKIHLYDVLVKTFKLTRFEDENLPIQICRICFKATQLEDYNEIGSLESKLTMKMTMCLPEFDINLTDQNYLCTECDTVIQQYHHFLLLCLEATQFKKETSPDIFDLSSKKIPSSEITDDSLSKLVKNEIEFYDVLLEEKAIFETDSLTSTRTIDFLSGEREISSASMSDSLTSSGEPEDNEIKVENTILEEATDSKPSKAISLPDRQSGEANKEIAMDPTPLAKAELEWLALIKAASRLTKVSSYECQVCPEILLTFQNLLQHMEGHQKDKNYFCWKCGYKCHNFWAIYRHFQRHRLKLFKVVKNKNNDGDAAGDSSEILKNSRKVTRSAIDWTEIDGDLLCVKRKRTIRQNVYTPPKVKKAKKKREKKEIVVVPRHPAKNGNKCFQCQICQKIFNSILGWPDHIAFHRNKGSIGCWRCGEWFESLDLLREHFFLVHFIATFYKLVPPNVVASLTRKSESYAWVPAKEIKWCDFSGNFMKKSLPLSPSSSTISAPCIQCNEIVIHDSYMDHACKYRPNRVSLPENSVEKQKFNCIHCKAVFSSQDNLNDHNCTLMKSVGSNKRKSGNGCMGLSGKSGFSQNPDADYECFYCLLTFDTITGLNNHNCKENLESTAPEDSVSENIASMNTALVTTCEVVPVREETLYECSYCVTCFKSELELNLHKCNNASAISEAVSIKTEGFLNNTEDVSAGDGLSRLIKAEPDYDSFLLPNSHVDFKEENDNDMQYDTKVSDSELVSKNLDDVLKSGNVINLETLQKARVKKRDTMKEKVNMFGVNIVEEKDRKLENHSLSKNNLMIFVCSWCTFVTSMEDNYNAHILTHKENGQNNDMKCILNRAEEQHSLQAMSNELFNFEKFKDGRVFISENVSPITDQKKKSSGQHTAGHVNRISLAKVAINRPQATVTCTQQNETSPSSLNDEHTLSTENIWPCGSDLDDLGPYHIPREDKSFTIDNTGEGGANDKNSLLTKNQAL